MEGGSLLWLVTEKSGTGGEEAGEGDDYLPNSRALLPIFRTNCPDGSHFAQMGFHFAQNTTPNSCSLLSNHKLETPFRDMYQH